VAIIINNDLVLHIRQIHKVQGRCITLILTFKNKITMTISGIYNEANKSTIAKDISNHIKSLHKNTISIIGGDFNEHLDEDNVIINTLENMELLNLAEKENKQY